MGSRASDVRRTTRVANRGRGVVPLARLSAMNISQKVSKSWLGWFGPAASILLRYVRVGRTDTGLRRTSRCSRSPGNTVWAPDRRAGRSGRRLSEVTDPPLLPEKGDMSSISPRPSSHQAGGGSPSRRHGRMAVAPPGRTSRIVRSADMRMPSAMPTRVHAALGIPGDTSERRAGLGARRLFRPGSPRGSALASWRAAACASSWLLRREAERPRSWAASGASRSGDIFIYVVPRGCRP